MILRVISTLAGPKARFVEVVVGTLFLAVRKQWWNAAFLLSAVSGTALLNKGIKFLVQRRRPRRADADGSSFPSGHASGVLSLLGSGTILLWRSTGRQLTTATAAILAIPAILMVGLSRVLLREHFIGDVLGGYALGAAWLSLVSLCLERGARAYAGAKNGVET